MGKNKARHLLHGILDLFPLFVIPIFAIYTRNENYNSNIEIQVQEKIEVNFNQLVTFNEGTSTSFDVTYTKYNDGYIKANGTSTGWSYCNLTTTYTNRNGHKMYIRGNPNITSFSSYFIRDGYGNQPYDYGQGYIGTSGTRFIVQIVVTNGTQINDVMFLPQCFDLTQMFGQGNEPSISEFNEMFPNAYYPYTESEIVYVNKLTPTTYNDTDVGSQFVYTLYNTVDKYFNMGNVFGMNDVYDWFVINIFGGNAPLGVYIVWNIILYEFVMDLLFLLYGLFMFFIDMCKRLMEKPLNSIK